MSSVESDEDSLYGHQVSDEDGFSRNYSENVECVNCEDLIGKIRFDVHFDQFGTSKPRF